MSTNIYMKLNKFKFTLVATFLAMLVVLFPSVSIAQTTITIPAIRDCVNCPGNPSTNGTGVVSAYTCNTASAGTLTVGTAVSGVTQTITATVTTVGTYNISATANGVTFAATGTFTATGSQPIVLTATGTPITNNTSTFVLNTTPNCYFNRAINGGVPAMAVGGTCPTNLKFQYFAEATWGLTLNGDVYGMNGALEGAAGTSANFSNYRSMTLCKVQNIPVPITKLIPVEQRSGSDLFYSEATMLGNNGKIYNISGIVHTGMTLLGEASTGLYNQAIDFGPTLKTILLPNPPTGTSWIDIGIIQSRQYAINNLGQLYYFEDRTANANYGTWQLLPFPDGVAAGFSYTGIVRNEYKALYVLYLRGSDGSYYSFSRADVGSQLGLLGWGPPLDQHLSNAIPTSTQIKKMILPVGTVLEKYTSHSDVFYLSSTDGNAFVLGRVGRVLSGVNYFDHPFEDYTNIHQPAGGTTLFYTSVPKQVSLPAGATRFYTYRAYMAITDIGSFTFGWNTFWSENFHSYYKSPTPSLTNTYNGASIYGDLWRPVAPHNEFSSLGKYMDASGPNNSTVSPGQDPALLMNLLRADDGTVYRISVGTTSQAFTADNGAHYLINGKCDDTNPFPEP